MTSRRDEQAWLGRLPGPAGAAADADARTPPACCRPRGTPRPGPGRSGLRRPLLRYAAGNPLAITVLVGQALRDHLATTAQVEAFVEKLRGGEADLEAGEDAALGRTRSLAASLSYGFTHAFTDAERGQLAVLHLFRDTIDANALRAMGDPQVAGDDAVPQLTGLTRDTAIALLDRAADIGLLSPLGGGYYAIHPALPWYFTTLHTTAYGPPASPPARPQRAPTPTPSPGSVTTTTVRTPTAPVTRSRRCGLRKPTCCTPWPWPAHAQHGDDATGCLQGLSVLYQRTGRDGEWARLIDQVTPEFIDPATGGPLPGRADQWGLITQLPGPAGDGRAGLGRPPPASSTLSLPGPRTSPLPPWLPPAASSPPSSAGQTAASPSPCKTSATSSASRTIRAACPTTRKPSASTNGSAPAPRKPSWRSPSATPTRTSPACGTWARLNTGISTASPTGPMATPSAAPKP